MTPAPGGSRSAPPPAEGLAQHGRQVPVPAAALVQRSDQTTARRGLGKDAAGGWVKDEREVRGKEGVPVCLRRRAPQLALPDARPTTFYPPPEGRGVAPSPGGLRSPLWPRESEELFKRRPRRPRQLPPPQSTLPPAPPLAPQPPRASHRQPPLPSAARERRPRAAHPQRGPPRVRERVPFGDLPPPGPRGDPGHSPR